MKKEEILKKIELDNRKEYKIRIYQRGLPSYFNSKATKTDIIRKIEQILDNYDIENSDTDFEGIVIDTGKIGKKTIIIIDYYHIDFGNKMLYYIEVEEKKEEGFEMKC